MQKGPPSCLEELLGIIPQLYGDYFINQYKDPYKTTSIPVVPGQAGGGSFQKKKNYIAQKEFAYRMCARRPTSAMPKSFLCCERAFCRSMVVMFCALKWSVLMSWCLLVGQVMWWSRHLMRCDGLCCVMSRDAMRCHGDELYYSSTTLYYKVLLQYYPELQSTTHYSSTTLYYKVLLQYYSVLQILVCILQYYPVLQSTTQVVLCTTKYYSNTTPYYKYYSVLLQYYPVLQSTTPILLRTTNTTPVLPCTTKYYSSTTLYYSSTTLYYKVLLQYYSVLQILLQYYPVLQSTTQVLVCTTPVLTCTTKYYSSTTLYYKVLLQYYPVLQSTTQVLLCTTKYFMIDPHHIWNVIYNARSNKRQPPTSANTAPATQNESHDWSASHMKRHLQCAEQQASPSNFTKYRACHAKWISWLIHITYETSFTMRGATGTTLQPHQILRLPRKMNVMIDRAHLWNVISTARSNRHHPPTSPSTAPATQNESHDWSASHMKRHLQCVEQQAPPSNRTKYCAWHAKWISWLIRITYETSFTMRGATGNTLQPHQILRLPRKMNLMIAPRHIWNVTYNARSNSQHPPTSPNTAPATQNDRPKSDRNLLQTAETQFPMRGRSENDPTMIREWSDHEPVSPQPAAQQRLLFTLARSRFYWKLQRFPLQLSFQISPNAAPATKSDTWTSPNAAPATQNESHDWSASHMKRHFQCVEQQASPSNRTKYCACHAKWMSWLIVLTYETSFPMRRAARVTLPLHQVLRLPRKMNLMFDPHHIWNVISNARSNRHQSPTSPNTAPTTQNSTPKS